MAVSLNDYVTLSSVLKRLGPNGAPTHLVDTFSGQYPMVEEGTWVPANGILTHEFAQTVTNVDTATFVGVNQGVAVKNEETKPVVEYLGRLEDRLEIDTRILEIAPNAVQYRLEQEQLKAKKMIRTFNKVVFSKGGYGNRSVNPLDIDGLGVRYNKLSANVVSNGGTGSSLGSIWIVKWGPDGVNFLYPQREGSLLEIKDLQIQPTTDSSGRKYDVVVSRFKWTFGLAVYDDRVVKRLCNITANGNNSFWQDGTNAAKGEEALIDLITSIPDWSMSHIVLYTSQPIMAQIWKRIKSKGNVNFQPQNVWGRIMPTFFGFPIVQVDSLAMDETALV